LAGARIGNPSETRIARTNPPGYFEVLMTSINVMQDYIARARLAGESRHT
jgi:hypothetical protein